MKIEWTQPFHLGLLLVYDEAARFETPELDGTGRVAATRSGLAIPVRHAQDIDYPEDVAHDAVLPWTEVSVSVLVGLRLSVRAEFEVRLECPSGRLVLGDAEQERVVEVPSGGLLVLVHRDAGQHAQRTTICLLPAPSAES